MKIAIGSDHAGYEEKEKLKTLLDQLGIQYAWKAGFDPKGYIAFLDSLTKAEEYSRSARFTRTKPALGERLIDAFSEILYLPQKENYAVDSTEFRKAKECLER